MIKRNWRTHLTLLFLVLVFVSNAFAGTFKLPDTGQTQSYTTTFGEDSDYNINPLSYTNNGDGTVTDNNTGLMWQQDDDNTWYNWYKASGRYDASYNRTSKNVCGELRTGGYSDWRLPSKKELITIINYGEYSPSIDITYFPTTKPKGYWSSTEVAGYGTGTAAWIGFYSGSVGDFNKSTNLYVRCVRGGQLTFGNFQDNGDGTVTDNATGLMWVKVELNTMSQPWNVSVCQGTKIVGEYLDWRLPNIKELATLINDARYNPAIDMLFFPWAYSAAYWSSTTDASNTSRAWVVNFDDGSVVSNEKYVYGWLGYMRCVRGGIISRTLTIASSNPNSGVSITVSPNDNSGQGNGITQFTRIYNDGISVTLTAPSAAEGNNFSSWIGCDSSTGTTCYVTMNADKNVAAQFICMFPEATSLVSPSNGATGASTTPTLNWSDVFGATTYDVQVCSNSGCTSLAASANVTNRLWVVSPALNQGTQYWWRVRANNSCGSGAWSSIWSFTTNCLAPGTFSYISPSSGVTNQPRDVDIDWGDSSGATSYDVYFGTNNPPPFLINATSSYYDPGTLNYGTTYYWKIVAKNSCGNNPGPVWDFTTIPCPNPATPSNPSPLNGATGVSTNPTLSWSSANADSYDVYFGTSSNPSYVGNVTINSYPLSGLNANTTYYWKIVAKNNCGNYTPGPVWSFSTTSIPITKVTLLLPNGGEIMPSGSSYTIQWGAPSNAVKFKLQYSIDNGLTWYLITNNYVTGASYNWTVPTLLGNKKTCLVKVIGYNASNVKVGADRSDAPFTIEVVKLTSPNGGVTYTSGDPLTITWTTNGTKKPVAKVKLYYTKDAGVTWIPITTFTGSNPGTFDWKVPTVKIQKNQCKVRVVLIDALGNILAADASDSYFTIKP